jgi:N-acetylmuramoyl-L-alanine amidase
MAVIPITFKWNGNLTPLPLNKIQYIIVHHAQAVKASPQDIHQWHLQNGWLGAGYNEYITKDGNVYIMRGDNVGSHCKGYNGVSYGICLEGDYNTETQVNNIQYNALLERIKYNTNRFSNKVQVMPHGALCSTECPGKNFPMAKLFADLSKPKEHWAEKYWRYLNDNGIKIHEQRFDDKITRAEAFTLLAKIKGCKD